MSYHSTSIITLLLFIGNVRRQVYARYIQAAGVFLVILLFIVLTVMQATRNLCDWWLAHWVTSASANDNTTSFQESEKYYLTVYGSLAAGNTIFTFFRAFLFAYCGIVAAKLLHRKLLTSVLKGSVSFFDRTPIGRLVNRFSSDTYCIDDSLPFQLNRLLKYIVELLGTFVMICYGLPWFALCLVPLLVVYYFIQRYYRYTTCALKRLCTVSLSPLYAHFSDTVTGIETIRAFRATKQFRLRLVALLDDYQRAQFAVLACGQWLSIRLQFMGVLMVTAVAFIAVLQHHYGSANAGLVGLAISYALAITGLLSDGLTCFTECEKELVSVERVCEYIDKIDREDWSGTEKPPASWPRDGVIYFHQVSLRYASYLPRALNVVSFKVGAGQKVGIVGRTGSGKSSIFQALFRSVRLDDGFITIDNINIEEIPLSELRKKMVIIPQSPFMFSGSLRDNFDIRSESSDSRIMRVVRNLDLEDLVDRLGGIDNPTGVGEHGQGLSVGEKQLICLARALLSDCQIICLDEATAQIDGKTDENIQKIIRLHFKHATVLTIAHRLETILDSQLILVMKNGQMIEYGQPNELIANSNSEFNLFVKQSI